MFGGIALWSSYILTSVYSINGKRSRSYKDCVLNILGRKSCVALAFILYIKLFMDAINYTVGGSTSIIYIVQTSCGWNDTTDTDACNNLENKWVATALFLCTQLPLNMMPNLESIWWVSMMGAIMSFFYSSAAIVLAIWQLAVHGMSDTSLMGNSNSSPLPIRLRLLCSLPLATWHTPGPVA